ncbi:MAG: M48 family metallopeptidase [Bacteroidia bacterium]
MTSKIYKELTILLLVFGAIWSIFSLVKAPKVHLDPTLPIETEEELGDMLMEHQLKYSTQVKDSTVVNAINKISERLLSSLDSTQYYYKFYVIEDPQVNAFATLGGHIVIYTGLLNLADSPEEIAAVLAHEIGHVEERHVSKMLVKKLGIGVITSILTGGDPAIILEVLEMSISNVFSRQHEGEADDFGLELLEKSNLSPTSLATIFRKMKDHSEFKYEKELGFLMTHPETDQRIRKSLRYKTKKDFKPESLDVDWSKVKEVLR